MKDRRVHPAWHSMKRRSWNGRLPQRLQLRHWHRQLRQIGAPCHDRRPTACRSARTSRSTATNHSSLIIRTPAFQHVLSVGVWHCRLADDPKRRDPHGGQADLLRELDRWSRADSPPLGPERSRNGRDVRI